MGVWPDRDPPHLKVILLFPRRLRCIQHQWYWNFSQVKDYGNKINGGFVNIELSRIIKDFENSRSVAEHLAEVKLFI